MRIFQNFLKEKFCKLPSLYNKDLKQVNNIVAIVAKQYTRFERPFIATTIYF